MIAFTCHSYCNLFLLLFSLLSPQDSECIEPKVLSLATLFASQPHQRSSKPDAVSPLATPLEGTPAGLVRPPVARALTYEDAVNSNKSLASKVGNATVPGCSDKMQRVVIGGQPVREDGGNAAAGFLQSTTSAQQQQQQPYNQPQQCSAIQKLMQGPRGVSGVVGVLQTVSESPENRLCDNGLPLEHHHHHHLLHHHHHQQQHQQHHPPVNHHHHHHHHHHQQQQQQQQQQQLDPIKRLFQTQPLPASSTSLPSDAPLYCTNHPLQQNPHLSSQLIMADSVSSSHFQSQQSQQLCFSLSNPQPEAQHNSQSASAILGSGKVTKSCEES